MIFKLESGDYLEFEWTPWDKTFTVRSSPEFSPIASWKFKASRLDGIGFGPYLEHFLPSNGRDIKFISETFRDDARYHFNLYDAATPVNNN